MSLPSGTKQTLSMNAMISAPVTRSSIGFGLRLTTPNLPRTPFRSLQDSRTRGAGYSARLRRGPQLREQIGDGFRRQTMPGGKHAGLLTLRTQIANPNLEALRNRDLGSYATEDQLP